jgi:hypothetical protein
MLSNIKSYLDAKKTEAQKAKAKVAQQESIEAKAQAYAADEALTAEVKETLTNEYYLALKTQEANARTLEMTEAAHKAAKVNQDALGKLETDLDAIYENVVTMQDKAEALRVEAKNIKAEVKTQVQQTKSMSVADRIAKARAAKNTPVV